MKAYKYFCQYNENRLKMFLFMCMKQAASIIFKLCDFVLISNVFIVI